LTINMIDFQFKPDTTYDKRSKSSLIIVISISLLMGLIATWSSNIMFGLLIALFFFSIQYYKSDRWDKTFINNLSFDQENIKIEYQLRNDLKTLQGHTADFKFKKQLAFNKTKTSYLAVYQNDQLKLKQFEIGDWTENKMDDIIKLFGTTQTQKEE
jgi:hypothetical protein